MKRQIILVWVVVSTLITVSAADEPKHISVTFYHTSDLHEHAEPLSRIAGLVQSQKSVNSNVLFVDTGDWFNKGDLTELNTRGEAMSAMMEACQFDALIPGNHDHSFGTKRLAELIDCFSLPVVAANVVWPDDIKPQNTKPYRIFKLDGVTVAIIGTATHISSQRQDTLLEVLPMEASLRDVVAKVKKHADIVVLLTHIGTPGDEKLAQALPGVDIIFGGHDHKKYTELTYAPNTDTVIQHSGSVGQCVGELTVIWDGTRIVDRRLRTVKVTDSLPESTAVAEVREALLAGVGPDTEAQTE